MDNNKHLCVMYVLATANYSTPKFLLVKFNTSVLMAKR